MLCYTNQVYLSKSEELAIYCHHFILGQLLVAATQPENIDKYICKMNEVKLIICLYDKSINLYEIIKFMKLNEFKGF